MPLSVSSPSVPSVKSNVSHISALNINHFSLSSAGTPPKVIEPLKDKTLEAGKETTLKCKIADGEPSAAIHWYKDNKEIYAGKRFQLSYVDDAATLQFSDTSVSDSGVYRCEAVNKLGRVETECKVIVQCK